MSPKQGRGEGVVGPGGRRRGEGRRKKGEAAGVGGGGPELGIGYVEETGGWW